MFNSLRVRSVERLTDDAAAVTFEVPQELADAYRFEPGQSLTLRRQVDGAEERRTYSICAPLGEPLRIGVREIPGGLFSGWLVNGVRPGDHIDVLPPTGTFRPDLAQGGRHLCIAAGSGITPMLSIAASLLDQSDARVCLLYGNRTTGSVMFAEELSDLKNAHGPRFELIHVLSREPREVELFSGRIDAERLRRILQSLVPVDGLAHAWLCGPLDMVTDARVVLLEAGLPAGRVHTELFYVDEPPPTLVRAEALVDGATSEVTVVLDGRSTVTVVPRAVTVLDSAQRVRPDLPFACKGGVCGTCRAKVTHGEVDLVRNYALEPDELEAGFVLTCQSFPVTDEVTVDYDG